MRKTVFCFGVMSVASFFSLHSFASIPAWELVAKKQDVIVYKKQMPGSDVLSFKGEGIVDAPVEKVAAVILDANRAPEWVVDLKQSKIVRWVSPREFIEYDQIKTPPLIMKDRDFVSSVKFNVDPKTKEVQLSYRSTEEGTLPEVSRYIRGNLMSSTFHLKPLEGNSKTLIQGEIHCDPKGSVPKWLVNWAQKSWPFETLTRLRAQVAKKDVVVNDQVLKLFSNR